MQAVRIVLGAGLAVAHAALCSAAMSADRGAPAVLAQAVPEVTTRTTTTRMFTADVIDMSLELLVIVNFWSSSCASCRAFAEQLERVARRARLDVRIVFVDLDRNPELAQEYGIATVPTTFAFQDGVVIGRMRGTALDGELEDFVASPSHAS